jgi:hypothetical protein
MAPCEKTWAFGGARIERDVRAITAAQPGQRASTKPAQNLEDRLQETLEGRGGGRARRRTTIGCSAKPDLSTLQPANGGAARSRERREPVREAPVPRVRRRIEHVGQTGPQGAGNQFQKEMLGALLLGLGEGEAPSGEGTDSLMRSSV